MKSTSINPEKITHPFQLMAAWFAMLILLVSAFLTGAANIDNPKWASGFLVITAFILTLLVIAIVFMMLTRFRPHLQDGKEYSEWLKDERRYSGTEIIKQKIRDIHPSDQGKKVELKESTVLSSLTLKAFNYPVSIVNALDADELIETLKNYGFRAEIYRHEYEDENKEVDLTRQEAIWLGANVPVDVICHGIKASLKIWPHLKYLHLSSDSGGPDYTHEQLFIGGSSSTAEHYGLVPWSNDELLNISPDMELSEFHKLVRSKYS